MSAEVTMGAIALAAIAGYHAGRWVTRIRLGRVLSDLEGRVAVIEMRVSRELLDRWRRTRT